MALAEAAACFAHPAVGTLCEGLGRNADARALDVLHLLRSQVVAVLDEAHQVSKVLKLLMLRDRQLVSLHQSKRKRTKQHISHAGSFPPWSCEACVPPIQRLPAMHAVPDLHLPKARPILAHATRKKVDGTDIVTINPLA